MADITYNLRSWISKLTKLKNSVLPTAIVNVIEAKGTSFNDALWAEIRLALEESPEFNYPVFKSGLKLAAYDERVITIRQNIGGIGKGLVFVNIDMDKVAGTIEDYAKGVAVTRGTGKISRGSASAYWAYFIYKQAREGLKIKAKRKPGQRGRTPLRNKEGADIYKQTIATRLSTAGKPAPFWKILDSGLPGADPLDAGGWAYPSPTPTNFLLQAEFKIKALANEFVAREQDKLYRRLELEEYGGSKILDQITESLARFEDINYTWTPGEILKVLEIGERRYNLYITGTGKLGLTQ